MRRSIIMKLVVLYSLMAQNRDFAAIVSHADYAVVTEMGRVVDGLCLRDLLKDHLPLNGHFLEPCNKDEHGWVNKAQKMRTVSCIAVS